jgi:hypothetical protein
MEISLGNNKIVTITPWKTKTKKEFLNKIKSSKDNIDENLILDILFYPYIEPKDIYLSEQEIQWLFVNIRKISIHQNLDFQIKCGNCEENIPLLVPIENICEYSENNLFIEEDIIIDNKTLKIKWKDLKNKNSLESMIKNYPDETPGTIEMLLHIESIDGKEIQSFGEILEFYEDLSLDASENIIKSYNKNKPKVTIKTEAICPSCDYKDIYYFESIPDFFTPLLPPDIK